MASVVGCMNEVTISQARLVQRWVRVSDFGPVYRLGM